jgi:hypothetical protein
MHIYNLLLHSLRLELLLLLLLLLYLLHLLVMTEAPHGLP